VLLVTQMQYVKYNLVTYTWHKYLNIYIDPVQELGWYRVFKKSRNQWLTWNLVFPGRLISKRLWPPRSPDLSPPDLFLWGHLKDTVY
jgi:hypothetical protein